MNLISAGVSGGGLSVKVTQYLFCGKLSETWEPQQEGRGGGKQRKNKYLSDKKSIPGARLVSYPGGRGCPGGACSRQWTWCEKIQSSGRTRTGLLWREMTMCGLTSLPPLPGSRVQTQCHCLGRRASNSSYTSSEDPELESNKVILLFNVELISQHSQSLQEFSILLRKNN